VSGVSDAAQSLLNRGEGVDDQPMISVRKIMMLRFASIALSLAMVASFGLVAPAHASICQGKSLSLDETVDVNGSASYAYREQFPMSPATAEFSSMQAGQLSGCNPDLHRTTTSNLIANRKPVQMPAGRREMKMSPFGQPRRPVEPAPQLQT
jgi:hypothetical protein